MTSNPKNDAEIYVKEEILEDVDGGKQSMDDGKGVQYVIKTELHDDVIVKEFIFLEAREEPEDDSSQLAGTGIKAEPADPLSDDITFKTEPDDVTFDATLTPKTGDPDSSETRDATHPPGPSTPRKCFLCNVCGYSSDTIEDCKSHVLSQHGKPFGCDFCDYRCNSEGYMKKHMQRHTGEKPYACKLCDFRARHKTSLDEHMLKHDAVKPYACSFCDYRSVRKIHLKEHMMQHTGEMPFACEVCDYRARCRSNFRKHMTIHTGEKPFSCDFCEFKCRLKAGLASHMVMHTQEKPFTCSLCTFSCRKEANLRNHMSKHSDVKPYECNLCGYKTKIKGMLNRHMMNHSTEKPFKCDMCDYRGKQISYLNMHKTLAHKPHANSGGDNGQDSLRLAIFPGMKKEEEGDDDVGATSCLPGTEDFENS